MVAGNRLRFVEMKNGCLALHILDVNYSLVEVREVPGDLELGTQKFDHYVLALAMQDNVQAIRAPCVPNGFHVIPIG
jgi:hypothetical protein